MDADISQTGLRTFDDLAEVGDPRVNSVLEVLAGDSLRVVANRWAIAPALLHRWVLAFVNAGTAEVTNHPSEEAARQRDRFLAAFAHELRTPLGVATGWASMLRGNAIPDDKIPEILDRLCNALDRLTDRTLDMELLAASSLGRLVLAPKTVRVSDLTTALTDIIEIGGEGGALEVEVDPELFPHVLRDMWQARALPPTPRSTRMEVITVGSCIETRIVREADPIDTDVLHALFEPFDLNDDGTGVTTGLYLARALTVAHGGTIGVDQDEQGAVLWVRVPRHRFSLDERPPGARAVQGHTFKLACGDVLPGCAAGFISTARDELLSRVARHAASAHGITEITPEVQAAIESKISVAS